MKKVLVTGLCTLHWGRLQFGNIGNYYIIEPLFLQLHRVFPDAEIVTTFQMTQNFIEQYKITVLPMDLYYSWNGHDVQDAKQEYDLVSQHKEISKEMLTPYMKCIQESILVINVSGDMWGDNAEHVGHERFLVDLYKMRTAQLLGKKTVLFAGTPGPFTDEMTRNFAKEVYSHFSLIINREPTSTQNMGKWGFESARVKDFACPAFLYYPQLLEEDIDVEDMVAKLRGNGDKILIGFTIGGFNMPVGPYDMWPRHESQYRIFVEIIEEMVIKLNARVVLISHTNGFELPPNFKLVNGRDYPILKQLQEIIIKRGNVGKEDIICLEGPYLPRVTKTIIGKFDMFVTGRVHASVAAITQYVPTVFITYEKSFIPSTKMYGFADLAGIGEMVCEPGDKDGVMDKVIYCYHNMESLRKRLEKRIPEVQQLAMEAFNEIRKLVD
ncbi:colanic acid/amylovoran biosynthesis protein [Kineothrix alysoides]|uniref:Colanic acid/amylovoran biosynthesis protein n=1 Tax=Kineothrix alysoides TaxID=1469948 RepID=A0A4R1R1Y4_9FIRM|nr:polysaccharide pyruvyl transferase family protein [Kineothrix alysoides]TCL59373.1 colanic acid/amylovoran biosynthesis protein [Kineothrix alysoides]